MAKFKVLTGSAVKGLNKLSLLTWKHAHKLNRTSHGLCNHKLKSALECTVWPQCTPVPGGQTDGRTNIMAIAQRFRTECRTPAKGSAPRPVLGSAQTELQVCVPVHHATSKLWSLIGQCHDSGILYTGKTRSWHPGQWAGKYVTYTHSVALCARPGIVRLPSGGKILLTNIDRQTDRQTDRHIAIV